MKLTMEWVSALAAVRVAASNDQPSLPGLVEMAGQLLLPAGIPHPYATISQPSVHRGRRHAHSFRDPSQRPPGVVQLDRLIDLSGGEPLPPRLDAMTLKDGAHGPSVDAELATQGVDGRPGPVAGDQLLHLLSAELPSGSGHASLRSGVRPSGRTSELPNQGLQLAKQGLCVVVASRLPHDWRPLCRRRHRGRFVIYPRGATPWNPRGRASPGGVLAGLVRTGKPLEPPGPGFARRGAASRSTASFSPPVGGKSASTAQC